LELLLGVFAREDGIDLDDDFP
ncbi:hypothetical protein PC116_g29118, partial [Phytophthora cactorum]